jgi:YfiH family protein
VDRLGRREGVERVEFAGGMALLAGADGAPVGLSSEALARLAGEHFARIVGRAVPVLYARQEHARLTFTYSAAAPLAPGPHLVGVCDVLITAERGVALCVRTADCLPIVLAGGGAVAMVHGGWRGLAADILGATLAGLNAEFGVAADRVAAAIGVGVGPCHYQVGDEVVAALSHHEVADDGWRKGDRVDLARWARGRLLALGVAPQDLLVLPGCSACSPGYYSYRRDGTRAGRQWNGAILL